MAIKKVKPILELASVDVDGSPIPAKIYTEPRHGVRFALVKNGAILRLPLGLSATVRERELHRFQSWVIEKMRRHTQVTSHVFDRKYEDGEALQVGGRTYHLQVTDTDAKSHSALCQGSVIFLKIVRNVGEENRRKAIRHLLSRVIAKDFMPDIERRVQELNHQYFNKQINNIVLKYNVSNWGSCSTQGNINLSTCLLFAPGPVIDYVIIHELAHLLEMNHSPRFWKLVAEAMPDYKEKQKWLRLHWQSCNF